jgi:hypothetical protein
MDSFGSNRENFQEMAKMMDRNWRAAAKGRRRIGKGTRRVGRGTKCVPVGTVIGKSEEKFGVDEKSRKDMKMDQREKKEKKKKKKKKKKKGKKNRTETMAKILKSENSGVLTLMDVAAKVCFGPEYSSDDAGDGPEYLEWGDLLITERQMRLILGNSEKWEFYLQLKVTSEDWWADPEKIYKAMECNMSAEYFNIFRRDVEKGRIGHLIGFHDFLRGFENSPLGVTSVPVKELTRRQKDRAHGADWNFFSRCTGGSWIIGAWELLGKIKMMDRSWGEEEMQDVISMVAEEFKREVRDEDLTFDDFVRLRVRLWRRRRARQEMRRAWERLKDIATRDILITTSLETEEDSISAGQGYLISVREFEPVEEPMVARICWKSVKASRKPGRVKRRRRKYEHEWAHNLVRMANVSRIKNRPPKSPRRISRISVVKKIWKVRGRRRKRLRRRGRTKAVMMGKTWKVKRSRAMMMGRAAKVGFGYMKRELHGLRPQEAWLAWTSARDGIG